jgi:membrane protease YdiL (CAAX protease family)
MSPIESGLMKAGLAAAAIALVLFRARKIPRDELGLARPLWLPALLIGAAYLAWMLGSDALIHWRGPWDFQPWQAAPLAASALRVLAVCMLGPAAEELIFRGLLFALLRRRLGATATIFVTGIGWALLHYSYGWQVVLVIVVDGLLLGLARERSRSVYPPIAMHMLYNLYAIW